MGYEYAWVHLQYTIPPAVALTLLYRPFFTTLDVYKILFLISIAVIATTPWDSYLIHHNIWTYPPNAIIGPTLFKIPLEEIFFFVVQTYNTSLIYLIFSKPTFHPIYLRGDEQSRMGQLRQRKWIGQAVLVGGILAGVNLLLDQGKGVYMGLILVWAGPFVLLLWTLAYQFILGLPFQNTVLPITLPTVYLWIVDTLALKRGTWVIESGTKLEWHLWEGLDIEEAVFFLATNLLIVFGLVAFDNSLAILQAFPSLFADVPYLPSPVLLIEALLKPTSEYDERRIVGLREALERLRKKSRSFYLASSVFQGRLRIDLILLYSFFRAADDLIDNASSVTEARSWITKLSTFLDKVYSPDPSLVAGSISNYVSIAFPSSVQSALIFLPTEYLSPAPLYDLLKGFEMDLDFSRDTVFPMQDLNALQLYASRVAATVAESCLELVYHHSCILTPQDKREKIIHAGGSMGIALQYVNIARDVSVDAKIGRVYLPSNWLNELNRSPEDIIKDPGSSEAERLRQRLLDEAAVIYEEVKGAIEELPLEARGPMRVAVESYMEIGRILRKPGYKVKAGRATVPKARRLRVAWNALSR